MTNKENYRIEDECSAIQPGDAKLDGYLEKDIRKCIQIWTKQVAAYPEFADFFSEGRPVFAAGEMWGKAMRSACMFYRYAPDDELKKILDEAVAYLLGKERVNGSISCTAPEFQPDGKGGDLWERKYVLLGFLGYYESVEKNPEVLASMVRQADCLLEQIGPSPKIRVVDSGWSPNNIESSTLLEPIMRLYHLTGHERYLEFAAYIVSEGGTKNNNLIDEACENVAPHLMAGGVYPKAYEMMSFFEGLVEYHRTTGDERTKKAAINLFNNIRTREITVIGSGGGDTPYHITDGHGECWDHTAYEQTNPDIKRMMETCVGVTWLKFCSHILRLTGDPAAVDEMEKYIYNGLIGAYRASGDKFSYMNLLNGVKSEPLGWGTWIQSRRRTYTCCDLNGAMGIAMIPYIALMNSKSGPVINLYNKGEFNFSTPKGQKLVVKLDTNFPVSGSVQIRLELVNDEEFSLQLRIPDWSRKTELRVKSESETVVPGTYKTLKKKWKNGDVIELELDMRCRIMSSPKNDGRIALLWGPVVLVRDENMDSDYAAPVDICSENGYVKVVQEEPFYDLVRLQYKVPLRNGGFFRMVDYASADNWNSQHICTWLPIEKSL